MWNDESQFSADRPSRDEAPGVGFEPTTRFRETGSPAEVVPGLRRHRTAPYQVRRPRQSLSPRVGVKSLEANGMYWRARDQVLEVTEAMKAKSERSNSFPLKCKNCGKNPKLGERLYNRRGINQRRASRIYCIACTEKLGLARAKGGRPPPRVWVRERALLRDVLGAVLSSGARG